MEKTYRDGYVEGVKEAVKIIMDAERNPEDMTRLSMKVTEELKKLTGYNRGCN